MSSAFAASSRRLRSAVSSSTASSSSALTIWLGLTTISRTTPSIGEVTGIGRSGVISAGARALRRTGMNAASAASATPAAIIFQVTRLFSQPFARLRSLRHAHRP